MRQRTVFSRPGEAPNAGCSRALGGYLTVRGRESDGGGRGEIGLFLGVSFFVFLFVGDIIISSIQKRGERDSRE